MRKIAEILLLYLPITFIVISFSLVIAYKWIPVKWTPLMLKRMVENIGIEEYSNKHVWVEKSMIDPVLIEAIIIAEDQRFYSHSGFDIVELKKMKDEHDNYGKGLRGCSTISQQVAKNCFTFGTRNVIRKLVEAYYTVLIELIWGKERILEVYLNVAETGIGLYGVEAACRRYFGTPASEISVSDAAALACVLPKPLVRTPRTVMTTNTHRHSVIARKLGEIINRFEDVGGVLL